VATAADQGVDGGRLTGQQSWFEPGPAGWQGAQIVELEEELRTELKYRPALPGAQLGSTLSTPAAQPGSTLSTPAGTLASFTLSPARLCPRPPGLWRVLPVGEVDRGLEDG